MSEDPLDTAPPDGGADGPASSRARSHRASRSATSSVLPVLVVAVAVLAIGVGIYGWMTVPPDSETAIVAQPVAGTPTTEPSDAPPASPVPTSPSATADPSESASAKPSKSPAASKSPKPSPTTSNKPKPTPSKTQAPPPVARTEPVVVLNQSAVTGLAATTAARLERLGWNVTGVGNWRGNVPTTTVYYPPGELAQARQLARDLGVSRVLPRVAPMRPDRLTVILTQALG